MYKVIFLNGKFVAKKEANIPVLTPGFLYGWGLFETMRYYNNHIVYFDEHLKRLKKSCASISINLPYSFIYLKEIIKKLVKINGLKDAYVRLTLFKSLKETGILVIAIKYQSYSFEKYHQGFSACIFSQRQSENYFLAQLKTTSHLFYRIAYQEAKKRRFDEAIILNNRGYIVEGSRSNIFLVKDNQLFTPNLECGCLDGITRRVVFDLSKKYKIKVNAGNLTVQDLYDADGAFLTNSLIGIMPLTSLEKHPVAKGLIDGLIKFFMKKYNLLLRDGT